jgi:hypothetical protein
MRLGNEPEYFYFINQTPPPTKFVHAFILFFVKYETETQGSQYFDKIQSCLEKPYKLFLSSFFYPVYLLYALHNMAFFGLV